MTEPTTPEEVIDAAAGIIERDGWYQGDLFPTGTGFLRDTGYQERARTAPVCAMGAMYRAVYGVASRTAVLGADKLDQAKSQLFNAAHKKVHDTVVDMSLVDDGLKVDSVPHFNDLATTTKEDVLLLLKRAAHGDD